MGGKYYSCEAIALTTLYQGELYFLPTHIEEPEDITISSGLLLIQHQCYLVFLQSVCVIYEISFCPVSVVALHGIVLSGRTFSP
jgi:hypothetical protein